MVCNKKNKIDYYEEYLKLDDYEKKVLHERIKDFDRLTNPYFGYFGGVKIYYTYPAEDLKTFRYFIILDKNNRREEIGNRLIELITNNLNYNVYEQVEAVYTEIDKFDILMDKYSELKKYYWSRNKGGYLYILYVKEFLDVFHREFKCFV